MVEELHLDFERKLEDGRGERVELRVLGILRQTVECAWGELHMCKIGSVVALLLEKDAAVVLRASGNV